MAHVKYFWDEVEDNVIREYDENNNTIAHYTTEPTLYGSVISQERSGQTRYYHFDGQGNTTELTDENGNVTDTRQYSAFGEVTESTGTTTFPYQWGGRWRYYLDDVTTRVTIRHRVFDVMFSRWSSSDPLGTAVVLNLYAYAHNNPASNADASGLLCCCTESKHFVSIFCTVGFNWGVDRFCSDYPAAKNCTPVSALPATWQETCKPGTSCGTAHAPPLAPPATSPPTKGQPCYYPKRRVCYSLSLQCWESQCVCQCAGNSKNLNCIRGCILCSHNSGAPINIDAEEMCQAACGPLTANDEKRLNCCLNQDYNHGGCSAASFQGWPPMDPNPANTACTSITVP